MVGIRKRTHIRKYQITTQIYSNVKLACRISIDSAEERMARNHNLLFVICRAVQTGASVSPGR
jgi:hypothetical protein